MVEQRVYIPPEYVETERKGVVFLAGPIQGTYDWQSEASQIIQSLNPDVTIASPRREVLEENFDYDEQVNWELHHLKHAGEKGAVMFWLARETQHNPERAFAQTSRIELGRWLERSRFLGYKLAVGIEEGFSGSKYIRKTIIEEFPNVPLLDSLPETCGRTLELLDNSREYELWRQDDFGNRFKIGTFTDINSAEKTRKEFEDRGHKQMYEIINVNPNPTP